MGVEDVGNVAAVDAKVVDPALRDSYWDRELVASFAESVEFEAFPL